MFCVSILELISMPSTVVSSKTDTSKSQASNQMISNDAPITEEELKKKEQPINVSDVLRLKRPTEGKR